MNSVRGPAFPGWNEIDAVELIGTDGSHQWARSATASSTYAQPERLQTYDSFLSLGVSR